MVRSRSVAAAILAVPTLVLAGEPLSHAPGPESAPSTSPSLIARARVLLAKAYTATDAAAAWADTNLTQEKAVQLYGDLKDDAKQKFAHAIDLARERTDRTLGVRLLAPAGTSAVPDWTALSALPDGVYLPQQIVLLVHGLDEPGDIWDDLAPQLRSRGFTVARFDYPNDGPIAVAADGLDSALRQLRVHGVHQVELVGHSMGGLVARDVLTRPAYYAGAARGHTDRPDIERLIMVGTPNHGSSWAHLEMIAEARDQFQRWLDSGATDTGSLVGFMVDGRGEAADDLLPGSKFLTELNARPAPTGVEITSVAGKLVPFTREKALSLLDSRFVRSLLTDQEIQKLASEVDRATQSLGDGPVSVNSVALDGVSDFVICEGEHCFLLRKLPFGNAEPPAVPIVLDRLSQAAKPRRAE